mgnify:CR=1 FL=1
MKKLINRIKSFHPAGHAQSAPPASFMNELSASFQAGRLDQFEQKANEAIRRWPDSPVGWKALGNLFLMQGRYPDALEAYAATIARAPGDAQAHLNLGSAYLQLGRFEEAQSSCRQALAIKPDYIQAHTNLGIALMELGRPEEAAASHRQALALSPDYAEAHNNLGNALKQLERFEEAEASYRQAVALRPDFAEAQSNLGLCLFRLRRIEEAEGSYRKALALNPDFAPAHSGLGDVLLKLGRSKEAVASFRRGIELDPFSIETHDGLNSALTQLIPMWHVPMMNDKPRNDAYFAALQAAVTPDTQVLEIGTGSGLLSMMAAKLGANKVTTCEAVAEIAATAKGIVADNGYSQTVTVIPKLSTKLELGVDLDDRADLLVSEILSSEFLGEGVLSSIEDAKRRLLKPGARIIPARGSIRAALFGGNDMAMNIRVDEVYGFNLSRFNSLVPQKQYVSRSDLDIELLSDDTDAFFFDFTNTDIFPAGERKTLELPVRCAGRCCGIVQWIRLEMDDAVVFENHPSVKNPATSWQQCVYLFPKPLDILPGQTAVVTAVHNRNIPWFFFEGMKSSGRPNS